MASDSRRGGALLAVLWLAAALAAIAFTVAHTVRGETERTATAADGVRAYYLATGGIERALLWMQWAGESTADGKPKYWRSGIPLLRYDFPTGEAVVEIIPESSKLNINSASPEELGAMLAQVGAGARASAIAQAIVEWRTPSAAGSGPGAYSRGLASSFEPPHASFQEIEELLLVRGMTPELFYGRTERGADGRLTTYPGVRACVSVFGSAGGGIDVNTAEPPVLLAAGIPPDLVSTILRQRAAVPFTKESLAGFAEQHPSLNRLTVGGGTGLYTLRSTARVKIQGGRLSDLRRTVETLVALLPNPMYGKPWQILRWYENSPRLQ